MSHPSPPAPAGPRWNIRFSDAPLPVAVWLAGALALLAWLSPNHEPPWLTFVSELSAGVSALILGAWVLWVSRREPGSLPMLAGLALFAALIPWLQLAMGKLDFLGIAVLASLYMLGLAGTVIVGHRASAHWTPARVLDAVAWVVLLGALVSVWLALYNWQRLGYLGLWSSGATGSALATANLNQSNQLATLLVMGMLAVAALLDGRKIGRFTAAALVALFGIGLAMTQSRAGLAEVFVVAALFIAKRKALRGELRVRDIVVAALLVLAMRWLWTNGAALLGEVALRPADAVGQSNSNRLVHWKEMAAAIRLQPWSGWGWVSTSLAHYAVSPDFPATMEIVGQSHNLFIDLLVWNGVPIGLLLVGGLLVWFWLAVRRTDDSATLIALAIILAVSTHAMVEYPLHYAFFLLPVGFLAGLVCRSAMPDLAWTFPKIWIGALLATAGVLTAVIAVDYNRMDEDLRARRMEANRIGLHTPRHEYATPIVLSQLHAAAEFYSKVPHEGMTPAELADMARVAKRFPAGVYLVQYAMAMALNGNPREAREALRRICKTDRSCEAMKTRWQGLGKNRPAVAAIPWPED